MQTEITKISSLKGNIKIIIIQKTLFDEKDEVFFPPLKVTLHDQQPDATTGANAKENNRK